MAADAQALIKLIVDSSEAIRDIQSFESNLKRALSVGAIVGFGVAMRNVLSDSGKHLTDLADTLGITASSLQMLQTAAKLSSVGVEEFDSGIRKMSANIGQALITGTGNAGVAIKRLGLDLKEISQLPVDEQFKKITAELLKVNNVAERNALARDIFGKQGDRLIQVSQQLEVVNKQFEAMGIKLDEFDTEALSQADNKLDLMAATIKGGVTKAMAELSPAIITVINNITTAVEEAGGFEAIIKKVKIAIELATEAAIILFSFWAAGKIVAILGLIAEWGVALYTLITRIREVGIAVVVMESLATAGISAVATATLGVAGAVAATVAVNKAFDKITKETEITTQKIGNNVTKETEERKKSLAVQQQANEVQEKALRDFNDYLGKLRSSINYERDKYQYGELTAEINKAIAEKTAELAKHQTKITQEMKDQIAFLKSTEYYEKQVAKIYEQDLANRNATVLLNQKDNNLKEVRNAILQREAEFHRELTDLEKSMLTNSVENLEIAKARDSIEQSIYDWRQKNSEATKEQLKLEKEGLVVYTGKSLVEKLRRDAADVKLGINLADQLKDPLQKLEDEYKKSLHALEMADEAFNQSGLNRHKEFLAAEAELTRQYEANKAVAQVEYANREVLLAKQTQDRILQIQQDAARAKLEMAGVTNTAVIDSVLAMQKQVGMIQQGGVVGAQGVLGALDNVMSSMGATSKKAFEAHKALAIAQAIISTYQAAAMAIAFPPGPPLSFIYVAGAIAAGFAQINAIRSQQYTGRALGGPVVGGQTYMVGEKGPELFTPSTAGSITPTGGGGMTGTTNINFTILANDTRGFDELLTNRKGIIQKIITDAQTDKGRRQLV